MTDKKSVPAGNKLNPDIKKVDVGIRELKTITIYPLSAHDQFDLTNRIVSVITDLSEKGELATLTNEEAVNFIQTVIRDNLQIILEYVVDEEERPSFDELTNNQIYTIVSTIFEVNYEGFLKNFKDLFKRAAELVPTT